MTVVVACPHCGAKYKIPEDNVGRSAGCRACGEKFRLGEKPGTTARPTGARAATPGKGSTQRAARPRSTAARPKRGAARSASGSPGRAAARARSVPRRQKRAQPRRPTEAAAPEPATAGDLQPHWISPGLYAGFPLGGQLVAVVLLVFAFILASRQQPPEALVASLFTGAVGLAAGSMVFWFVALYHLWSAIQPVTTRTTPARAVGFLFLPFFNLYWIFVAFYGWTREFRRCLEERGSHVPPVSGAMALVHAIAQVSGCLGALTPFTGFVFFQTACRRANQLTIELTGTRLGARPRGAIEPSPLPPMGFVLSLVGMATFGLGGVAGVILGIIGLTRIRRARGRLYGRPVAILAIVFGVITTLLGVTAGLTSRGAREQQAREEKVQLVRTHLDTVYTYLTKAPEKEGEVEESFRTPGVLLAEEQLEDLRAALRKRNVTLDQLLAWPEPPQSRRFAFNESALGTPVDATPPIVFIFECEPDGPITGRRRHISVRGQLPGGPFVLMTDGTVRQVPREELTSLAWTRAR